MTQFDSTEGSSGKNIFEIRSSPSEASALKENIYIEFLHYNNKQAIYPRRSTQLQSCHFI